MEKQQEMETFLSCSGGPKNILIEGATTAATTSSAAIASMGITERRTAGETGKGGFGNVPKKRAVALTAFIFCLTFLMLALDNVIKLARSVMENEKVWTGLEQYLNRTKCSCPPPLLQNKTL